jgi:hypothetical protein
LWVVVGYFHPSCTSRTRTRQPGYAMTEPAIDAFDRQMNRQRVQKPILSWYLHDRFCRPLQTTGMGHAPRKGLVQHGPKVSYPGGRGALRAA